MSDKPNPSLLRQVAPAAILTATGVAFVSLLDNPTGTNKVSLDAGATAATTTVAPDAAAAVDTSTVAPGPEVTTTLAPSPATTVVSPSLFVAVRFASVTTVVVSVTVVSVWSVGLDTTAVFVWTPGSVPLGTV